MAELIDPDRHIAKLYAELVSRRRAIAKLHDYYDGVHNLAFAGEKFLEAFGGLFDAFADNWCGVVADALDERLQVNGFRLPKQPSDDAAAKAIWERNELDAQSSMAHLDAIIGGAFYAAVWIDDDDRAEITVESASTCIVERHPKMARRRTAALRVWLDDDGFEHAELFRPEGVYLRRSKAKRDGSLVSPERARWVIEDHPDTAALLDVDGMMPNAAGNVVPVVEFLNKPRLTRSRRAGWGAHSEIAKVIPLQDACNKFLADILVSSEFAAYPQRNLVGYTPDEILDPETGKPTGRYKEPNFQGGPGKLWWLEDPEAKFDQFDAADLSGMVQVVEMVVQHIASISATPPHYLNASADRLSGESIKSAESGLVAKARRRQRTWGAGWEEVMRLAGRIEGISTLAAADGMETVWKDPEVRTESEHVDALSKKKELGVPEPQLWQELDYTEETVQRFPAMRAQMQLEGMAANAAERARLAETEATRLRQQLLEETGGGVPARV